MNNPNDQLAETAPSRAPASLGNFQAVYLSRKNKKLPVRHNWGWGCATLVGVLLVIFAAYFLAPLRSNILILGVDGGLGRGELGRTDTIILATISPLQPKVGMLSIPRDLWVSQLDGSENRINTAFFFAEAAKAGSGAEATRQVIYKNFGIPVNYAIVLRMDGVVGIVDALGGIDIQLDQSNAGYSAGMHHLDGVQALEFARNRSGSDDFSRMMQGQILLRGLLREIIKPTSWPRLPAFYLAVREAAQIDIPLWLWPRLGLAILRAGPTGITARAINREMVTPFTTSGGAQVLQPDWEAIGIVIEEVFR